MENEVKLLKAMADETRIKILLYLLNGEQCACTIVPFIGKAQPTVSQHLKILTEAGILSMRKNGARVLYRIKDDRAISIIKVLKLQRMNIE
ncbi:MAG: metalloregulator ArsR/SmtB family transcription factor [Methanocella sp.]